jgi:hypothetical protein
MSSVQRFLTKLPEYLIALVLVAVPFYALLTVWAASFVGHYTAIRLWPEYILAPLALWTVIVLARDKKIRSSIFSTRLARLIIAYLVLNILVGVVALLQGNVNPKALFYGLLLNTRPLIWLGVVWVATIKTFWLWSHWQRIILLPLAIVAVFAVLQFFVLPSDFLAHFGYKAGATIAPAQTINQDTLTIRAQAFLRGPNQLGAYLVVGLGVLLVTTMHYWRKLILLVITALALIVSFSRSAWLGLVGVLAGLVVSMVHGRNTKRIIIIMLAGLTLSGGAVYVFRNNDGLQNALFHVNEHSTASVTSNEGHVSATNGALHEIANEPFGRGSGTAGPASDYNTENPPRNSESYFLNIGQELGWLGVILFLGILYDLLVSLRNNKSTLGQAVLYGLYGLILVNIFSYAWIDPTLSYIWWGLAGLVVAGSAGSQVTTYKFAANLRVKLCAQYRRRRPAKRDFIQFAYFNLGGVVFFVVGYLVFALLFGALHWHWLIAKCIGDLVGWGLNYLIQHYLAFNEPAQAQGHRKILKKYVPFSLLNVLIDYAIVGGLRLVGVTPFIGLWVASLFFTVWKWLWYKHWIFARK